MRIDQGDWVRMDMPQHKLVAWASSEQFREYLRENQGHTLVEGDILATKDGYAYRVAAPPQKERGRLEVVLERAEYDDRIDDDSPYADRDE